MAFSIGFRAYNLTDFSQHLSKCPHCAENKLMVFSSVDFFQFNAMPIYPKKMKSWAVCRGCSQKTKPGDSPAIDQIINNIEQGIEVPKSLKAGAILYPLAIISVVAFILSMEQH
jgi:hypothetical protein